MPLPVKISVVSLGNLKFPVNISELVRWDSKVFKLHHGSSIGHLPDAEGDEWDYPNSQLLNLISADSGADFTVGIINAPLEDNYYIQRLSDRVCVLSLYEMGDIARYSEFSIEHYILRNIYEMAVLYLANGKLIPDDYQSWAHDDIRGCLFDMNSTKSDIVFSLNRPILCEACTAKVNSKQIPAELLPALRKELPRIQKSLYVRMAEWVRAHPIWALLLTAASGILLNLVASVIFEKGKSYFPWLG